MGSATDPMRTPGRSANTALIIASAEALAAVMLLGIVVSDYVSAALWLTAFAVPGVLVVLSLRWTGARQAFCVGAAFPASAALLNLARSLFEIDAGYTGIGTPGFERIFFYLQDRAPQALVSLSAAWLGSLAAGFVVAIVDRMMRTISVSLHGAAGAHQGELNAGQLRGSRQANLEKGEAKLGESNGAGESNGTGPICTVN